MRYTTRAKRRHLQAQAEGPLSVSAYCEAHDLSLSTFYSWKRKLSEADATPVEATGFTEIRTVQTPDRFGLRLSSGLYVELSGLSIDELAELIVQIDRTHA